ncbi:uncharacterized protein LOC111601662 [Drosophila hydei]|uniref:Uncharacterized protein LOC111601662 n=1 Tax=Drosophila hydei TaxID=7224 RepID=A0A6J1M6U8_DROHY|nr:uncharacterized protein LOC111601662 [Drosophila hydei]
MEPPKRKAHQNATITNLLRSTNAKAKPAKIIKTSSAYTQTEPISALNADDGVQTRISARPASRVAQLQQQKKSELHEEAAAPELQKRGTKNKACQTQKIGLKRGKCDSPLDALKSTVLKRRKMAIDADRVRLKKLLDEINSDPPPSWHTASLMWLDVDVLERRIEEFEKEEEAKKNTAT